MAERVLADIAMEAEGGTSGCELRVVHRTGELKVGEASVAIAISTPHRAEAFSAARYVIEEIKKRLPVWKHEHYADGAPAWVRGVAPEAETSLTGSGEEARVNE
jgi:molybdopterin synthase catalytic subunit